MEVAIIGSGPAALTAGIYLGRAGFSPVLFEGTSPGGLLMTTTAIENYPGFEGTGPDLIEQMYSQAEKYGVVVVQEAVKRIYQVILEGTINNPSVPSFEIISNLEKKYNFKAVIIATGSKSRLLGLTSEAKFWNRGVSTCAVCDGPLPRFRNKEVAVVGGGDSALEEALFLSRFASKVHLIHRGAELGGSDIMKKRAGENHKIIPVLESTVDEVLGDDTRGVSGVRVKNGGKVKTILVSGLFIAIGHIPESEIFRGLVHRDSLGYIMTRENTKTHTPGLFVCGDVCDRKYRQAITAAGSGCMAALDAVEWLGHQQ